MTSFIALYRGDGTNPPHIVAVTSDTDLVTSVVTEMLKEDRQRESERDPVLQALRLGRRNAMAAVALPRGIEDAEGDNGRATEQPEQC